MIVEQSSEISLQGYITLRKIHIVIDVLGFLAFEAVGCNVAHVVAPSLTEIAVHDDSTIDLLIVGFIRLLLHQHQKLKNY